MEEQQVQCNVDEMLMPSQAHIHPGELLEAISNDRNLCILEGA
jgi:hypothetical protein